MGVRYTEPMYAVSEIELVELVRMALTAADALDLKDAAIHLNEALIARTDDGVMPSERGLEEVSH